MPLKTEGQTLGALVIQTYTADARYSDDDRDLLAFVGQHIATALSRARAIEETRERNAELAVINEIGDALARQLDFQAIIELVGEKVREIFDVRTMAIALYDPATQEISTPFALDEGSRYPSAGAAPWRRPEFHRHPRSDGASLQLGSRGRCGRGRALGNPD